MKIKKIKLIFVLLLIFPIFVDAAIVERPGETELYNSEVAILEELGTNIYTSPSIEEGEVVFRIPKSEYVEVTGSRVKDDEQWYFVKYNFYEGWLLIKSNDVKIKLGQRPMFTYEKNYKEIKLYDRYDVESNNYSVLKANSELKVLYEVSQYPLTWLYVESGNIKGWTNEEDSLVKTYNKRIVLYNDTYVYSNDFVKSSVLISGNKPITIKEIKTYNGEKYGLYEHNGKDVWIKIFGKDVNYAEEILGDEKEMTLNSQMSDVEIHESFLANSKVLFNLENLSTVNDIFCGFNNDYTISYCYVTCSKGNGWTIDKLAADSENKSEEDEKDEKKIPYMYFIIFGGVILLIILALIIIKKKSSKVDNNKDV